MSTGERYLYNPTTGEKVVLPEAEYRQPQPVNPLDTQVAGDHYKSLAIQPVEYIHANGIPFMEGSAIKYLTRWRNKGGLDDLKKAKHFIELLIELETRAKSTSTIPL